MTRVSTLCELIERNEHFFGDEPSLVFGDRTWTFAERARRGRSLAGALYAMGMRHQDRVAVLAMNCLELLDVYAAGNLAGFIVCPVNYRLAEPEVAYILNRVSPKVVVFEAQYAAMIASCR